MKRVLKYITVLFLLSCPVRVWADEGMWLINLMERINYETMQAKGVQLSAEEIYSETQPSLKDAIVALDYGSCTGSMISQSGLMITNHHCAYDDIQKISSMEHDYLKNGFWAKRAEEEIVIPGKTVMFLQKVKDVTEEYRKVLAKYNKPGEYQPYFSRRAGSELEKKYKEKGYELSCVPMLRGDRYYLFYYKVYSDVRLVGAPSAMLGAFGGDTDNWSWPQHKCDFSLYRVYADKDGNPAKYSKDNVPLQPQYVLPVSVAGLKEGDYAMLLGYPGSTARYTPSFGVAEKIEVSDPAMVKVRDVKLAILREAMQADPEVKLQYASKYFGNSNYWKYAIGEMKYTRQYDVVGLKTAEEQKLTEWIKADSRRLSKYGDLIAELRECYAFQAPYIAADIYHKETMINGSDILRLGLRFKAVEGRMKKDKCCKMEKDCSQCQMLRKVCENYFKDYNEQVDRKVFAAALRLYIENMHPDFIAPEIVQLVKKFDSNYEKLTEYVYEHSFLASREKLFAKLNKNLRLEDIVKDPAYIIVRSAQDKNYKLRDYLEKNRQKIAELRTKYTAALLEMNQGKAIYPDANSTMRITYGNVGGYSSKDAVTYASHSTIAGYPEKYVKGDPEFDLPEGFLDLVKKGEWGRYADTAGKLYTGFVTNQDITGGNSGSPVMNAKGELVGLAYDGNWESMAGDLYFHPEYNKCVCVDIRFVLWVIDKYAGAGRLIEEMNIKE